MLHAIHVTAFIMTNLQIVEPSFHICSMLKIMPCLFQSGLTPLHVASFMGCMNIVIYLLQHDASPDVPTVRGETPLHLAARANQTDIIRILLRNGAQVDARARVSFFDIRNDPKHTLVQISSDLSAQIIY